MWRGKRTSALLALIVLSLFFNACCFLGVFQEFLPNQECITSYVLHITLWTKRYDFYWDSTEKNNNLEKGLGGRGARGCVRTTSNPQKQFGQILYPWFSFEFSGPQPKNWLLCSHYTGRPRLLLEHGGSYRWWLWARCCHHCKGRHSYFSHCPLVTCI